MTDDFSLTREEEADIERKHGEDLLAVLTSEAGRQERDKQLSDLFNAAWRAKLGENAEGKSQQ